MKPRQVPIIYPALTIVLMLTSACNLPGAGPAATTQPPPEVFYTAAAQTIEAQLTRSVPTTAISPTETLPPLPTDTPTPQVTSTETLTPTPETPTISASVATNCRLGPSILYNLVGVLPVGTKAEVRGRNDAGTWWYIENPSRPGQSCWVWGQTTQVEGNTAMLPIITPPPSPPTLTFTPTVGVAYTVTFNTVHDCGGVPTAIFAIANSASELHSLSLKIEDLTASVVLFGPDSSDAPFMGTPGECPPGGDTLPTKKTYYIGGAIGSGNSGHSARATIRLCTQNGLKGLCADKTVEFTIP